MCVNGSLHTNNCLLLPATEFWLETRLIEIRSFQTSAR
jgi:hypothetical protein